MNKIICIFLSFLLFFTADAFAGWKTKAFFGGTVLGVKLALKSTKIKNLIIKETIKNPALKKKAMSILTDFIKDPKNKKYIEDAIALRKQVSGTIKKVNKNKPRGYKYAGKKYPLSKKLQKKYPEGVKFNTLGFPDFSRYALKQVKLKKFNNYTKDFNNADKIGKITKKYRDDNKLTWHHHQDGKTMQLVPRDIHDFVKHTGGNALK